MDRSRHHKSAFPHCACRLAAACLILCLLWGQSGAAAAEEAASADLLSVQLRYHSAAMLMVDAESGRIIDANESAAKFYGYSVERLIGMDIDQINILGHEAVAREREMAAREERNYFVFPHRLADGSIHTVEVFSSPVTLKDGRSALLSIIQDMSGRKVADAEMLAYKSRLEELVSKRTQELAQTHENVEQTLHATIIFQTVIILLLLVTLFYRRQVQKQLLRQKRMIESMLDSSLQFMGLLDLEGRLLQANQTALERFGVKQDQVAGRYFWDTVWWSHSPEAQARVRHAVQLASMGEDSRYEVTHPVPGGQVLDVNFAIRPVLDQGGRVVNLLVEGRDITSRKQAEEQLQARRRELQDANNYLKTLIGALPDTLMELDVDGRIYQYHAPATGSPVPTPEQGGSWNISDIFPEGVTAVVLKALADAAHTGGSRGATYALGAEPGAVACFELSVTRLPDSDGLPSRFVVLARELAGRVSDTENSLECH